MRTRQEIKIKAASIAAAVASLSPLLGVDATPELAHRMFVLMGETHYIIQHLRVVDKKEDVFTERTNSLFAALSARGLITGEICAQAMNEGETRGARWYENIERN